ncbi:MAG TPA: MFS transporter, partial [Naasia sp.]
VALLTALYIGLICLSAAGPPLIAAPLAELVGWRATLGVWAVLSVGALVPWLIVLLQHRGRNPEVAPLAPSQTLPKRMHRSRVARALALAFAISTLHGYAMFAWLPALLIETAGVSPVEGGSLLALYGVLGLPLGVLAPLLVIRVRRVWVLFVATTVLYIAGYLGLLLAPGSGTWVWTVLIGGGPVAYQFCLVLIGLRTRSHEAALALSGFVQAISYAAGALGPLVIGVLRDLTDGWTVPLLFLLLTALLTLVSAVRLARPSMVEDELDS